MSDCGNNCVSVFEADGKFLYHIIGTTDKSKLNSPLGIALDQCGNLHIADSDTNNIKVFTRQGQYIKEYYSGQSTPSGIAIDVEGNTFVSSQNYHQPHNSGYCVTNMCVLNTQHKVIYTHNFSNITYAAGITIDKEGVIYFCTHNNSCIYKCEFAVAND